MNRLYSTAAKSKPRSLAVKIGLGASLSLSLLSISFLFYNSYGEKTVKTITKSRPLPPVDELISLDRVKKILTANEVQKRSGEIRLDLNSVASNSPMEDYHSEHKLKSGVLLGVFDGHGGRECAERVSSLLSSYVERELSRIAGDDRKTQTINALKQAFITLDRDIVQGALDLEQGSSWNPFAASKLDYSSILKGLRVATSGSCAILAYITADEVYVASTGDCRAVIGRKMGYKHEGNDVYDTVVLSTDQTARDPGEFRRLCEDHPGEEATVVIRGRILGGLMPSRAFGDARYKWPLAIQEVFSPHLKRRIPPNYLSPPYVTAEPEVVCYRRDQNDEFLVLACDGLWDDMGSHTAVDCVKKLIAEGYTGNYATALMKTAMSDFERGGKLVDEERIRHQLSIPSPQSRKFRDDMTVNVAFFKGADAKLKEITAVPSFTKPKEDMIYAYFAQLKNKGKANL